MLTFQDAVLRLQDYWANQGALIWQPHSEKVGAGTMNPATFLRVLGPEPWNVAYVEPSYRPDDGRYADNPNRMQMHTQMQVILKPDPGDPQERYLRSLEILGIRRAEHDIRFVEDNWESPALGAWGLGWEVWLDGQEITQFTYFQQAGGLALEIPAVEITYGLERIVMYLQRRRSVWDILWDEHHTYGEVLRDQEVDYCRYNFDLANVERLQQMYDLYESEAQSALTEDLTVPAVDYILRCSHTFNLLDARGTVGVTERAVFFKRMRDLARQASEAYLAQRERAGHPWCDRPSLATSPVEPGTLLHLPMGDTEKEAESAGSIDADKERASFLFEIGTEELPAEHLNDALSQIEGWIGEELAELRLAHGAVHVWGTPRRLAALVEAVRLHQPDETSMVKGPPAQVAFDPDGNPTRAAEGFARSRGVTAAELEIRDLDGGRYVVARQRIQGRPAATVLAEALPAWIARLSFPRSMRWDQSGVAFSRPIRWLVALLGETVIPFSFAALESSRVTRGPRPAGSPPVALSAAEDYRSMLSSYGVLVDAAARREEIRRQAEAAAAQVGGEIPDDPTLLAEVANLVEVPTALLGSFEEHYLALPQDVLIAVMTKHQRYFPVLDEAGKILPHFVTIRNGGREHQDIVREGNEDVIRARYADAAYFYAQDTRQPLAAYREALAQLTFQAELGSMLDKTERLVRLAPWVGQRLDLGAAEQAVLIQSANLAKADLATQMVVEMTSLQGTMGREYALKSGEDPAVAQAIYEHYLPRHADDELPASAPGIALALADRADTLVGLFAVGLAPTGSADPYGLRRTASGMVQILLTRHISLSVADLVRTAATDMPVDVTAEALEDVLVFVAGRLEGALRDAGIAYDVVAAALGERANNPARAQETAEQLAEWVAREDWHLLLDTYARCVRITRGHPCMGLDAELLQEEAETLLYEALRTAEAQLDSNSDIDALMTAFLPLVPPIRRFFDDVLVMTDDLALQQARLALLQRIAALAEGIVDLSKLEVF